MSSHVAECGHSVPISCPECERPAAPAVTDSQLAVLLRQAQWTLDEAAHHFPAGRGTPQRREELAGTLEALAAIVRASVPVDPRPTPAS